jgi:23S rRNA maturation mini-RNase III
LIKFNEQIASKYRAGLSFRYLDKYLGDAVVVNSIREFYADNKEKQVSRKDFEATKRNSSKNIDWFFRTIIESRKIIDFKFTDVLKSKDSISFTIKTELGL